MIALEASALAWSALAHTVDSNSVEGRLCTLNYKEIPPSMAQRAVERPWIRHNGLKSPIHPHIHKSYNSKSNRDDRSQDQITSAILVRASMLSVSTQVPQPFGEPPQTTSLHQHHKSTALLSVHSPPHLRPTTKNTS